MLYILPVRRVGRLVPADFQQARRAHQDALPESSPVPAPRARQIVLTTAERHRLKKLACSHTAGYQQAIRVRIVLDAAHG